MGFFDGGFGGIASGVLGALGGAIGSSMDASASADLARMNQNWQREVYQNQLQWKAADAKKAGLHPLVAVGGGAYSASNIASAPSTDYAGSLGKLGKGIGDAFTAYLNRDELAKIAADKKQQEDERAAADTQLVKAQTAYYNGLAQQAQRRSPSHVTGGNSSGIPGQSSSGTRDSPYMSADTTFTVRDYGDGWYDINLSPDAQQELGDELGQVYNFVGKGSREFDKFWQHPVTGDWFRFYRDRGKWRKENPSESALDDLRFQIADRLRLKRRVDDWYTHFPEPRY